MTLYEIRLFTSLHAVPGPIVRGISAALSCAAWLAPRWAAVEVVADGVCVAAWVGGKRVGATS